VVGLSLVVIVVFFEMTDMFYILFFFTATYLCRFRLLLTSFNGKRGLHNQVCYLEIVILTDVL